MRTRMPSSRLAALGCLVALAAAPIELALADNAGSAPRLPGGWVRGEVRRDEKKPAPSREFGTFQSNHEFTFPVRSSIPAGRMDLASLPIVEVTPPSAPAEPPAELPAGSAGDVVVLKTRGKTRVSVQAFEAGMIQLGKSLPTAIGRQSEGGIPGACGAGATEQGIRPLSYEAIRRIDTKGSLELVWARGFLEVATCRVAIVERHSAKPQHVGGGVVYAFRTRCAACKEGEREVLHVLTPQMDDRFEKSVPFEHRTLALAPGKSAAFEGSSSFKSPLGGQSWGMPDWHGFTDRQCKEDSIWCFKSVRLEVSQGRGETAPTVFLGGDL